MSEDLKNSLAEILTVSRFFVGLNLDDSVEPIDAYFMECKGFKYTQTAIEVAEVFPQAWGNKESKASRGRVLRTKMPGNAKVNNISLRRGLSSSMTLWKWVRAVQNGQWASQLKNGRLVIYRQDGEEGARFAFERAWPVSYTIADSMVSGSELAFEELELAVETFVRIL